MAEEVVGSFPFEEWAKDIASALSGKGVESEIVYAGPRAYPVYVDERDSEKAKEILSEIGYMSCEAGSPSLSGSVFDWMAGGSEEEDCQKELEELEEEIEEFIKTAVDKEANRRAAEGWSTSEDPNLFTIAEFDGVYAVNGEVVEDIRAVEIPEGYKRTREGGRIPTDEQEIDMESILFHTGKKFSARHDEKDVDAVIGKIFKNTYDGKRLVYRSVSGDTETYRKEE